MTNLFGGTELQMNLLKDSLPADLLDNFQIIPTRLTEELNPNKLRIAYIHDLAGDPQIDYLKNGGWKKFHLIVFVSNWQMQSFINAYKIPWSRCMVMLNAIEPITKRDAKPTDTIKLIYTPTPHRGLSLLVPVFVELLKAYPNLELDVFSSFKLYGWEERDSSFQSLFKFCEEHPNINYHGSQPNSVIREALSNAHIFAYPSIWQETSCRCLIEAMSAGLICVHPNLASLPETSANWTYMYQYQDDENAHAMIFMNTLKIAIDNLLKDDTQPSRLRNQAIYADQVYNWKYRKNQWESLLNQMLVLPREFEKPIAFDYRTI